MDFEFAIGDNEEDEDYYSQDKINFRKELRRELIPKRKKSYYPPYD